MVTPTPASKLIEDLEAAFSYTTDNNRDLIGDNSFPMEGVWEELEVEKAYKFLVAYISRNADMINFNMDYEGYATN